MVANASMIRQLLKNSDFIRRSYYRLKQPRASSEANEAEILLRLAKGVPKTFIEFGFHPVEFNCVPFAKDHSWKGLLIDGGRREVEDAKRLWPTDRLTIVERFLTLDSLDIIRGHFDKIGILSIDVDGNDYWFLKALIDLEPAILCVEYNSTFGLRPITVPYHPQFDRHNYHPRGWYHGASLSAIASLCASHGYGIAAGADGNCNAFFTKSGRLSPEDIFKPKRLREEHSGIAHEEQWKHIKDLPFIEV